jgi:hypothetical protein
MMSNTFFTTIHNLCIHQVMAMNVGPNASDTSSNSSGTSPTNNPPGASGGSANFNIGQAGRNIIPHAGVGHYSEHFWSWVGSLLSIVWPIAALLVLLYLIWGAFEWITAEGDSGKLQKARNKMTHAVLGLIILATTLAIFTTLQQFLGICVINIGDSCAGTN